MLVEAAVDVLEVEVVDAVLEVEVESTDCSACKSCAIADKTCWSRVDRELVDVEDVDELESDVLSLDTA